MSAIRNRNLIGLVTMVIFASILVVSCSSSKKTIQVYPPLQTISSPGGYTAVGVKTEEEGSGKTIIKQGNKVITEHPYSYPVSFSPTEDILLLVERAPDDDCRHYLLNIGAGELSKDESKRLDYVFGGRYVSKVSWSDDGKSIKLYNSPNSSKNPTETFIVTDLLSAPSNNNK